MKFSVRCVIFVVAASWFTTQSLAATTEPSDVIERAAKQVQNLFRDDPGGYDAIFHPTFLSAVSNSQLTAIFSDVHKRLGKCDSFEIIQRTSARSAKVDFIFQDYVVPASISVDSGEKHLIDGLWLGDAKSIDGLVKELSALPGKCAFRIERLDHEKPETIASLNADEPLAIGSAFKLYILAELVGEIESGQRHWEDVVKLDAAAMSLPTGQLQNWPADSPITLHTLAALMISNSDNTAADQLLHVLGREKVEAILELSGNQHAAMDRPFLSTRDLFALHTNKQLADQFIAADSEGRRKLLAGPVASSAIDLDNISAAPTNIDSIEWFASANDLCRTMNYLRSHTKTGPAAEARKILSINHGLDIDESHFPYIGFKGGSEPGVLNLTYLVQSRTGAWYALAATWNNSKTALDEQELVSRVMQAFRLLS